MSINDCLTAFSSICDSVKQYLVTRFFKQYCVLVIWAVFCEFRSIEECTSLVGVLLAGSQGIMVRFYLCPFFCSRFIALKYFLPPHICHSFYFESLCFPCHFLSPYWQMNLCTPRCAFFILYMKSYSSWILYAFSSPGGFLVFFLLHFFRLASSSKLLF